VCRALSSLAGRREDSGITVLAIRTCKGQEYPMNVIHRSKLRHVEFTLAAGNIFDATVDAIVARMLSKYVLSPGYFRSPIM
jgi:hypothetical protein